MRPPSSWLLTFLLAASAVAVEGQELIFRQKLELPVAQDDIGYGQAVTADPHTGEVFVCDPRSNRILIFDPEGFFKFQILGGDDFSAPRDLAVDPDGFLLVLANRRLGRVPLELDFDGPFHHKIFAAAELPASETPRFVSIALSPDGTRVYLADEANLVLWITDRDGAVQKAIDLAEGYDDRERRNLMLGQVDVYGENVLLAVMSHGEVRRFDLDGKSIDFVGRKGTARCQLGRPTAAALTRDGEIFVIDQQRMLLQQWAPDGNRCLGEHLGLGSLPGYLYYPYDLALDASGQLFIAQTFDGRVQVFEGAPAAAGTALVQKP